MGGVVTSGEGDAARGALEEDEDCDVGEWIEDKADDEPKERPNEEEAEAEEEEREVDARRGGRAGEEKEEDEEDEKTVLCMGASGREQGWFSYIVSGAFLLPKKPAVVYDDDAAAEMAMQDLHSLCERGDARAVRTLLQNALEPDDLIDQPREGRPGGDTALLCAARSGHRDVLNVLIGAGARLDYRNDAQENATLLAAAYGHVGALECLLDNAAPVDDRALLVAVQGGHCDVVEHLTSLGCCDVEVLSPKLLTPLLVAVRRGPSARRLVRILCEAGADVNVRGPNGYTPVMHAAERDDRETAALLVNYGADLRLKNTLGYTAMDIASLCNHLKLFEDLYAIGGFAAAEEDDDTQATPTSATAAAAAAAVGGGGVTRTRAKVVK